MVFGCNVLKEVWPKLNFVLQGKWRKYRGIPVEKIRDSDKTTTFYKWKWIRVLQYDDFIK
jgi:hypothetical protein